MRLSGPTSFTPIVRQAMSIVEATNYKYHILVIIADGQIDRSCYADSISAIKDASELPLSIIVVGVGDGPWDGMKAFDDDLPKRKFDNIQFIDFNKCMDKMKNQVYNEEEIGTQFALHALMEIPEQYCYIKKFININEIKYVLFIYYTFIFLSRQITTYGKYLHGVPPSVQNADQMAMQS